MRLGAAAATLLVSLALGSACAGGAEQEETRAPGETTRGDTVAAQTTAEAPPRLRFAPARRIKVPRGFRAEIFATGLSRPTALAYGPDGRLYATEETGRVVVVPPRSRRPRPFASGFPTPLGLAWRGRTLFVSAQGRVERMQLRRGRAVRRRTILSGLPFGLHQQDNIVVGDDGRLYLGNGSTCNACAEEDARSATILSFRPDGSDLRIVATGLRNPFGLAFQPETDRLYVSVNSRDDLPTPSSPEPAEMLVRIERGAHYGWPECWPSRRRVMRGRCGGVERPVAYLEAHSSADGLAFYTGDTFPERFRGGIFVALWGQYASHRYGRRVDFVRLSEDGATGTVRPFADGFDHPLAVAVDPHGALLVADWGRGVVYRIQAREAP